VIKISNYDSTITYGGVILNVDKVTPTKTQKTRKSIVGKSLVETKIIGLNVQQWELKLSGMVFGTTTANLATNRAAIEALDDVSSHAFVDGIHDSLCITEPGSLSFTDSGDMGNMSYLYSMVLLEW